METIFTNQGMVEMSMLFTMEESSLVLLLGKLSKSLSDLLGIKVA